MGRSFSWRRLASVAVASAAIAACSRLVDSLAHDERPIPNEVDEVPLVREAVVPELLQAVDDKGLLRFPVPNVGSEEMPLDTALAQSAGFLFFGLNVFSVRNVVENQRVAFIDFPTLLPCSRVQLGALANDFRYLDGRGVGDTLNQWPLIRSRGSVGSVA